MMWILGVLCLATCGVLLYIDRWAFRSALSLFFGLIFLFLAVVADIRSDTLRSLLLLFLYGCVPLGVVVVSVMLIYNGFVMLRKEGRRLKNMLSLFFGAGILILVGVDVYFVLRHPSAAGVYLLAYLNLIFLYLTVFFISFLLYTIVCLLIPKRGRYDFIVVLGAGLRANQVSPLLARRLDKAIVYYNKGGRRATFVVSGGQGSDERVSEASAMRDYLEGKGVPREAILLEDRSTNTFENMKYSKAVMDARQEKYRCLFVTNDFHMVRSGMHARRVGLGHARGAGCRTAAYYWPSAFIREYLGMLARYKWEAVAYAALCLVPVAVSLL